LIHSNFQKLKLVLLPQIAHIHQAKKPRMSLFNVFILTSSSHLILTLSVNTFFFSSHHHRPHHTTATIPRHPPPPQPSLLLISHDSLPLSLLILPSSSSSHMISFTCSDAMAATPLLLELSRAATILFLSSRSPAKTLAVVPVFMGFRRG
jgi:hypothetical protein